MRDPVEIYFSVLRDIRASGAGVAETSFYPALAELLTALGSKLKPKVTAIINLRNTGARHRRLECEPPEPCTVASA